MGVLKVWDGSAWQSVSGAGGADVYVGPSAPAGTPASGDMWWDTDEVSPMGTPIAVANGGTAATSAIGARSNLAVPAISNSTSTAGPPGAGTWARGDQHLDSQNVVWTCTVAGTPGTWAAPPGTELTYATIATNVPITATTQAAAMTVFAGSSITYDGTPILITVHIPVVIIPPVLNGGVYVHVWDGSTDLGYCLIYNNPVASAHFEPGFFSRKIVPTPGTHTYSIRAWLPTGSSGSGAVQGNASSPISFRITRA